jgi:methyl-accepting chemotaxis protein
MHKGKGFFSRMSIRTKLSFSFSLVGVFTLIILASTLYVNMERQLILDIRMRLKDSAALAAMAINTDEHARLVSPRDENTPVYKHLKFVLQNIRSQSTDVRFVYTMRQSADKKVMFVVDAEENEKDMSHIGDIYDDAPPSLLERIGTLSGPFVEKEPYTDQWGTFLSAYAPLHSANGKVEGVLGIDISMERINKGLHVFLALIILTCLVTMVPILLFGWVLGGVCSKPIKALIMKSRKIAEGDLEVVFDEGRKDEIGSLARGMDAMVSRLRTTFEDLSEGVQTLVSSSRDLSAISSQMESGAHQTTEQANSLAATTEEISANARSIALEMEQATTRLGSVAVATDEMTSSIGEISYNSEKARVISTEAVNQTGKISEMIQNLGKAAQEIGVVTEAITSISTQTNLLALNATIEAARAGTAGKGFAVVASEIKELSLQVAKATEEIKTKIGGIQAATEESIMDIEKISTVINEVSSIVSTISVAIEEQSAVTKDIAGNISQASSVVREANDRIFRSSEFIQRVSQETMGFSKASSEMNVASRQVNSNANDLRKLAEVLQTIVGRVRVIGEIT